MRSRRRRVNAPVVETSHLNLYLLLFCHINQQYLVAGIKKQEWVLAITSPVSWPADLQVDVIDLSTIWLPTHVPDPADDRPGINRVTPVQSWRAIGMAIGYGVIANSDPNLIRPFIWMQTLLNIINYLDHPVNPGKNRGAIRSEQIKTAVRPPAITVNSVSLFSQVISPLGCTKPLNTN